MTARGNGCSACGLLWNETDFYPYMRSRCKVCMRAKAAAWNAENAERRKLVRADYEQAHREEARARARRWAAEHPERVRDNKRRYRQERPDVWQENNQLRRVRKRGLPSEMVRLETLVERDGGKCGICGKPVAARERSIDHIIPISKGGPHTYANTRLTHIKCNISRGNRTPAQPMLFG